jgi:hypothetical protein
MKLLSIAVLAAVLVAVALPSAAQPVISAKSGTIADVMGQVFLGNQLIEPSLTKFPDVKENEILRTAEGRAEVLLPPGVFLRLGENASFKMVTNRLIDTRVELLSGSSILEIDELAKDTNVTVVAGNATVGFSKAGLYRFDMQPARIKVFKGVANVEIGGQTVIVPAGKMLDFGGTAALEKFSPDDSDSLDNWSRRRSEYVAQANISAANYAQQKYPGLGASAWAWNPFYGMYTYLPFSGRLYNPYGYCFWSPSAVYQVYYNPPRVNYGGGFGGYNGAYTAMAPTSSGYSGTMASAPAMSSGMSTGAAAASSGSTAAASAGGGSVGHGSAAGGGHGR